MLQVGIHRPQFRPGFQRILQVPAHGYQGGSAPLCSVDSPEKFYSWGFYRLVQGGQVVEVRVLPVCLGRGVNSVAVDAEIHQQAVEKWLPLLHGQFPVEPGDFARQGQTGGLAPVFQQFAAQVGQQPGPGRARLGHRQALGKNFTPHLDYRGQGSTDRVHTAAFTDSALFDHKARKTSVPRSLHGNNACAAQGQEYVGERIGARISQCRDAAPRHVVENIQGRRAGHGARYGAQQEGGVHAQ